MRLPFSSGAPSSSSSPKLLLPMALSQSFVGEPFAGYLHLANISAAPVANVVLKVELAIGLAQKYVLFNNASSPIPSIAPEDFFHTDVEHELRNEGSYVLTCSVSYELPTASLQPAPFKRIFKFPAVQPFSVSHRVGQVERQLLVECTIENKTKGSVYLTSWRLDCTDGFEASLMDGGAPGEQGSSPSSGSSRHLLRPKGTHSLMFKVSPKSAAVDMTDVRQLDLVGNLALGWQRPDGPTGCAEGHQLRLKPCPPTALDLRVATCPRQVRVEEPFKLELEVVNRAGNAVEPNLLFDLRLMGGVRVHGAAQQALGRLEPYCTARVPLNLLVAVPGMHALQGVSLLDDLSSARSEFGVLCDILAF
mmetsp:Transcript_47930/g.96705  ORF Transcript_47930/g.96705 Transcript_47930/m.96705 type:complete len:363 (-) Transcript_47930:74-1162(-)